MGKSVFMVHPDNPGRVIPVDEFWVDYKAGRGWTRVTPAKAEKITEAASSDPTRTEEKGKTRG